jgi:hypothetical protein
MKLILFLIVAMLTGCVSQEAYRETQAKERERYKYTNYCNNNAYSLETGELLCKAGDCKCHNLLMEEVSREHTRQSWKDFAGHKVNE